MLSPVVFTAALLATSNIPFATAETCYAIGSYTTNSAGAGIGGTTISVGGALSLFNEAGEVIGEYKPDKFDDGVCSDFISVPTSNLTSVFEWGSTCDGAKFHECHGAYGDQTHIKGDEPENGNDFYGLGISTDSQCKVSFQC